LSTLNSPFGFALRGIAHLLGMPHAARSRACTRQPTWTLAEHLESFRFRIRDRDQKFTESFDEVFRSDGIEIIRTPFRAPQANGVAERFVRTVRSECLDWLLILNRQHLERVLAVVVDHYNGYRPHRALGLTPPHPTRRAFPRATVPGEARVQRRDRLGGVVREYVLAA
jgi:putative transposase